jgi:hypothetical protein
LREWVTAESTATQTPPDMAAMLALAVVATCCARRLRVCVRAGWHEPMNLYTCVVLPPGNRKSAAFGSAVEPLDAWEREQTARLAPDIAHAHSAVRIADVARADAERRAAKATAADRIAADCDARDAVDAHRTAEAAVPAAPRLTCGDATQEVLARMLADHGGRMAVMDAEGCGPAAVMLGRYARDGAVSVDVYLRGHAGDTIRVDRIGRESVVIRDPAITLAICAQPEVLRQLSERREMRGLGLLGRIMWCVPVSTVGRREVRPAPMPDAVRCAYAHHVRILLELPTPAPDGEPHTVRLSSGADDVMSTLERRLGPGGDLTTIADWASKLAGAVARIAALLHAAEHPSAPWAVELSAGTMGRAVVIGDYLLAHAQSALGSAESDPVIADAEHVLSWLRAHDARRVSKRDLYRALRGHFRGSDSLDPPLARLADHGYVRVELIAAGGAATRTVPTIVVCPRGMGTRDRRDTRPDSPSLSVPSVPSVPSVHGLAQRDTTAMDGPPPPTDADCEGEL